MKRLSTRILMCAAGLVLACGLTQTGCKGKSGGGSKASKETKKGRVGSCNRIKIDSLCVQYSENNFIAGEDHLKQFCDVGKGVFKLTPCPADKRLGRCVTPEGTKVYYSIGATKPTAAKAEKWCKEGLPKGKWTPAK